MPDGRYVLRDGEGEHVLVLETLGAPPPPRRRRRRARKVESYDEPASLPLARATVVRAFAPFDGEEGAGRWLEQATASEESIDALIAEGIDLLNGALHVQGAISGDPHPRALARRDAVTVRLGYGRGEEVAEGDFTAARDVGAGVGGMSPRKRRTDELQPQQRLAAVLGGREQIDACETLLLRARADLAAGRQREAALQLRVALEALLAELGGALTDAGHEEDMAALQARRHEAGEAANAALSGGIDDEQAESVRELVETCERVLRRRRVLRG